MSEDLKAAVQAALAEAGIGTKGSGGSAPPAAADQPPAWAAGLMERMERLEKSTPAPQPAADPLADALKAIATPAPSGNGKPYVPPPGAPNSPVEILEGDPAKWSRAYIDRLRAEGTFLQELEKAYGVGTRSPFRRNIPKVR